MTLNVIYQLSTANNFASKYNIMIIEKLTSEASMIEENIRKDYNRLNAIDSLLLLFNQIDFSAELVPTKDPDKMITLLTSLKGEGLTEQEVKLVHQIANN